MKNIIYILVGACFSVQAFAYGAVTNAKVVQVRIDSNGLGMVVFDQTVGNAPPSCVHPAYTNAFSFNSAAAGGKGILATALAAKASGATISVYGSGACGNYGGAHVEDWSYGVMQ